MNYDWDTSGLSAADDEDDARRRQIEEMMRSERERYFRDEAVQQEYRDIVDRQIARQAKRKNEAEPERQDNKDADKSRPVVMNDASFVPESPAPKADPRFLSPRERIDKEEALFGRDSNDQAAQAKPEAVRVAQNAQPTQAKANTDATPEVFKKHKGEIAIEKRPEINKIIEEEARWWGVNPRWLKIIAFLESGGDPKHKTGSYRGLFQFEPGYRRSWETYGGKENDIEDAGNSTRAVIQEFRENREKFLER